MEETKDTLRPGNIIQRFMAPTPKFFVRLRNWAIVIVSGAGAVLLAAPAAPFVVPAAIITGCQYIAFGGLVLGLTAQTTKKSPDQVK